MRADPGLIDHHDLTRRDVADKIGADDIERATFRGENIGIVELAEHQWPHTVRIAHTDQLLAGQRDERIGAGDFRHGIDQTIDDTGLFAVGDEMDNDFGVHGGLEDAALQHKAAAQGGGIGQVAVMGDGEAAICQIGEDGLYIAEHGAAGGGVAVMADGGVALKAFDDFFGREIIANLAHALVAVEMAAVMADDPGGFLPAMLQGMQAKGDEGGRLRMAIDAENAAFLMQLIVIKGGTAQLLGGGTVCHLGLSCVVLLVRFSICWRA